MSYLIEPIQAFQKSNTTNIAIFCPYTSGDQALYENLQTVCSQDATVQIVNEVFLNSYEAMNRGLVDILMIPELELMEKKLYYPVKKYIQSGGSVMIACNDYFMTGRILDDAFSQFDVEAAAGDAYYRATSGFLGIKPYVTDITPVMEAVNSEWIPDTDPVMLSLPRTGVQMNVSSDRISPQPPDGHTFIERYEVLRNFDAVIGCDRYGKKVNTQVTFAQNWENGSRIVLYSSNLENSPIRKENPLFERILKAAVSFCTNPVTAVSCAPHYACYRTGESVSVTCKVQNAAKKEQPVTLQLNIINSKSETVFSDTQETILPVSGTFTKISQWQSPDFTDDSYSIILSVTQNGRLLSKAENGFVVWNPAIIKKGPAVKTFGKYFTINGKPSIITGTNYYESNLGEVMWVKPNIKKLEADFKQMSENGINYIRIHYHHVKWFLDYLKTCTGEMLDYYKDLENEYLPNERILRIFDAHIYLSQKYQIIYGGDLFTLIPEEMGDPKGWYGVQDYLWFEDKLKAQKEFLELLIPRYLDVPGIAWDIYNEPCCVFCEPYIPTFNQTFLQWAQDIKQYMRELGDRHLITVGAETPKRFETVSDFFSEHTNFKYIPQKKAQTSLPEIIQECWLDRPATPTGDELQKQDILKALTDVLGLGFAGFVPWQWTNQQRLWCDWRTFAGEIWDDRLGTCVRNDGTLKPAGRFYRDFCWWLTGIEFLRYEDNAVITNLGTLSVLCEENGNRTIRLCENGEVKREIACGQVFGKTLSLTFSQDADLFYLSDPDHHADYIKANKAGILSVSAKAIPAEISICQKPYGADLAKRPVPNQKDFTIEIEDSDINYWMKLTY
jgi:hypothetical protein